MSVILNKRRAMDTADGDGVALKRVFGHGTTAEFDPFLMLDYITMQPNQQSNGFPWHPHAGIETITYLITGEMEHQDTMGNQGVIKSGELQWMSAGAGLLHQEMPHAFDQGLKGFQFWLNLPASKKYNAPDYRYIEQGKMPVVEEGGMTTRVIAGTYNGVTGPINKEELGVKMFHITLEEGSTVSLERKIGTQGFIFIFEGSGTIDNETLETFHVYNLSEGMMQIEANTKMEIMFAEGTPLKEPIAWYGPVVMNSNDEVREVLEKLRRA